MDMIQDWMIINKIKMGDPDAWDILVHKYYIVCIFIVFADVMETAI